jgi:hypothetical protein
VYYREQAIEKITKEKEMAIASKRQNNRARTVLVTPNFAGQRARSAQASLLLLPLPLHNFSA